MIRMLIDTLPAYNLSKLAGEIQAGLPGVISVNEVDMGQLGTMPAVYFEPGTSIDEQVLAAIVAAHDPTPEPAAPSIEQRIIELEEALALLHMEVSQK